MKVEIIYKEDKPIGWDIIPENLEDDETIATVRNLQFFGFDDTAIRYRGYEHKDGTKDKAIGSIVRLRYRQAKYKE